MLARAHVPVADHQEPLGSLLQASLLAVAVGYLLSVYWTVSHELKKRMPISD
jgi:hypothetical protein